MRRAEKQNGQPVGHEDVIMQIAALAYRDHIDREFREIAGDPNVPEFPPEMATEIHNSVMNDFAQFRKKKARKRRRRRIMRIIACLLVLCIVLPIGLYQVDAARVATVNFIIKTFPQYSEIHYDVQNNALPPIGWKLPYYPTWLPEGMKVFRIETSDQGDFIWYTDADGYEFSFFVLSDFRQMPFYDDEDTESQDITINGHDAVLSYSPKKNIYTLVIPINDCMLFLCGSMSETDLCKIGENINFI